MEDELDLYAVSVSRAIQVPAGYDEYDDVFYPAHVQYRATIDVYWAQSHQEAEDKAQSIHVNAFESPIADEQRRTSIIPEDMMVSLLRHRGYTVSGPYVEDEE